MSDIKPQITLQAGMTNPQLAAAFSQKLPGVPPTERHLSVFALGAEVGFSIAQDIERQDWSRVHHAVAKHGAHPGRTDDHLADVIDSALDAQAAEIERLQAALKTSATALERAAGDIAAWGAYADEYFQGKHELAADIEAARIAAISTRAALTPQKEQG